MLFRHRKYSAVLAFLLLAAPLIAGVAEPDDAQTVMKEGRKLAPPPSIPNSLDALAALPKQVDDYLRDRFGLRKVMIRGYSNLTKRLLAEGSADVFVGRNGRMFLRVNEAVRQSAGMIRRDHQVEETSAFLDTMRHVLASRGIRFLVALPPNAATIYQDDLPRWARRGGKTTEYDIFLEELRTRGVTTVDLRLALWTSRADGAAYFLHKSHWTERGALAAYNAIVEADGHSEWEIVASAALGPLAHRTGGDLARMIGVNDDVAEPRQELILPPGSRVNLPEPPALAGVTPSMPPYVARGNRSGETIMIVGDSFTFELFARMLLQHVEQVVWLHHKWCGFDWKLIDRFRPDEVWWMPTERYLLCAEGVRPLGFPDVKG